MAPENPPPIDPADLPLLMTLDQLRNPAPKNVNVSFLRRTQYIASSGMARGIDSKGSVFIGGPRKGAKPKPTRDDPTYVKKYIQKGFDIGPDSSDIFIMIHLGASISDDLDVLGQELVAILRMREVWSEN